MKVLLIGEYYHVHRTLAQALRDLGHRVDVVLDGNPWREDSCFAPASARRWETTKSTFRALKLLPHLRGYDVVQLAHPAFLGLKAELLLHVFRYLKKNNAKVFLGGFGYDYFLALACMEGHALAYSEFFANGNYRDTIDTRIAIIDWMHGYKGKLNRAIAEECDGILAGSYESYVAYGQRFGHKTTYVPYPIEAKAHPQCPPPDIEKVKFYINMVYRREELKGKDKLYSALYTLQYKRPHECEIELSTSTLNGEDDRWMDGCDVVIDQLYSYSPGPGALRAMSKGIVVVGGGEEAHYDLVGEKELRPIVNVRPGGNDVYEKLESLLNHKEQIARLSADGVRYIKKHHDPIGVATKYLAFWNEK